MKPRCVRCGRNLKPKDVESLELSQTDGRYYDEIPEGHISQGFFDFGATCALLQLCETIQYLKTTIKDWQR